VKFENESWNSINPKVPFRGFRGENVGGDVKTEDWRKKSEAGRRKTEVESF